MYIKLKGLICFVLDLANCIVLINTLPPQYMAVKHDGAL